MSGIYRFNPDDAKRFALEHGYRVKERGSELQFDRCPYCGEVTSKKYKFAISLETGAFNCMRASCGAKGNMLTLAKDFGFSLGRDVDAYYGSSRPKFRSFAAREYPTIRPAAVSYLDGRGINQAVTERYHITTRKDADNILVFPFYDEHGKLQFVKYRKTDFDPERDSSKEWCEANCKPILFGMDQCDPAAGPLVLTEGQIDSLSCAEAGIPNAVSVPTGAKGFTWVPYCWDWLGQFDALVVFGDHEHGKITLLEEMAARFHGTVKHVREEDYLECKDANEILRSHGVEAVRYAVEHAEPIRNARIKNLSEVRRKDMAEMERIDTGIYQLDKLLGGFYFGQLVILTGERGLGKSTLASQFGAFALEQNCSVFFYSGELLDWYFREWLDRQIAGKDNINTKTATRGYKTYSVEATAAEKIQAWYADRCFIYETVQDEPVAFEPLLITFETAIKQYGCRMLVIDNLMTALEDDLATDIYRQQSVFVRKLAAMAKQYNVLILLVVHPRKTISAEFRNDDVAGSANITNLADVVMNYSRPKDAKKDTNPPDRVLQVTKNRLTGNVSYNGIPLWFEEESKRISETQTNFSWTYSWGERPEFEPADDMEDIPF